jgi:hypothetical protein
MRNEFMNNRLPVAHTTLVNFTYENGQAIFTWLGADGLFVQAIPCLETEGFARLTKIQDNNGQMPEDA